MITKIGVICQDRISFGFVVGLRDRLKCQAELVDPPAAIGKSRVLTRRQANLAWRSFQKQGVDLVVRFTDSDKERWQQVHRQELSVVPDAAKALWICGIAVDNVEQCLCRDSAHLAKALGATEAELRDPEHATARIKRALAREASPQEGTSHVVARIIRDAPPEVFRRWLDNDALRNFYTDCRRAAARANCDTPNELGGPPDA